MKRSHRILSVLLAAAMVMGLCAISGVAVNPEPVSISTGDSVYIEWSGNQGTVKGRDGSSAIPSIFTLWAEGISSITVDGATQDPSYSDTTDGVTNYAYEVQTKAVTMTIVAGAYTITCPPQSLTPAGSAPTSVVSYLPLGQYASGKSWGTSEGKFAGKTGLDSTGVSLGALGGYIEFYFEKGIENKATNPYGVDFVVYGNAFNGNPEPGAVQVSVDGTKWYELAGSKYYTGNFAATNANQSSGKFSNGYTGTLRNGDVIYDLKASIMATLKDAAGVTELESSVFTSATAWWPLTSEGYPMGAPHTDSNVTVSHSDTQLTFGGITAIQDSNTTADYAFGYADVTPNGSPSAYGAPVNPYTPYTTSKTGGDGFDLAWAVDIETGEPVKLSTVKYVRVYSAVLDNALFGETSCEVCGIFTTVGSTTAGTTAAPTIKVKGIERRTTNGQMTTIDRLITDDVTVDVTGTGYIYINGVATTSATFTLSDTGTLVQIIVQNGEAAPYVTWLNLTR